MEIDDSIGLEPLLKIANDYSKQLVISSSATEFKVKNHRQTILDAYFSKNEAPHFNFDEDNMKHKYFLGIKNRSDVNGRYSNFSKKNNLLFLDKDKLLCNFELETCDFMTPDGHKVHYDTAHYTLEGARFVGKRVYESGFLDKVKAKVCESKNCNNP